MKKGKLEEAKPKTYTLQVDKDPNTPPFMHVEANEVKVNAVGTLEFYTGGKLTHARAAGEWLTVTLGDFGKVVLKSKEGSE